MPKPGEAVTQEGDYQSNDADHRNYWEKGKNDGLTPEQKDKLKEQADRASRYDRESKSYTDDIPRQTGGPNPTEVDHGRLVRNVKQYVADTLSPHGDDPPIAPPRPLGDIIDVCGTPDRPVGPPDGPISGEPNWVCINMAEYMAALLRELGYPVREVNTYLSQGDKWTYQSAALQVWFEGRWHFVDPFTCKYDPLVAFPDFTDMRVSYWNGTEPPGYTDWRVLFGLNYTFSSWWALDDDEVGTDLQDRFYPKQTDETGKSVSPTKPQPALPPGKPEKPAVPGRSRAKAEKAGCFIWTPTRGVRMYLVDSHGRITDGHANQIPGAIRVAAGTPILYCKQQWLDPGEDPGPEYPPQHDEWVFFGTQGYDATWDEIGTHPLTLYVLGTPGTIVQLHYKLLGDPKPAAATGLPQSLRLTSEAAAVPFTVTIDPIDPAFHVLFDLLVRNGVLTPEHYDSAMHTLRAMIHRAGGHKPTTPEGEPPEQHATSEQ